jgi:hypothetical protein
MTCEARSGSVRRRADDGGRDGSPEGAPLDSASEKPDSGDILAPESGETPAFGEPVDFGQPVEVGETVSFGEPVDFGTFEFGQTAFIETWARPGGLDSLAKAGLACGSSTMCEGALACSPEAGS